MTLDATDPKDPPVLRPPAPAAAGAARAYLECTAGPEKGKTFRVAPTVTVIGRDAGCDVVLTEPPISRQHARIERRSDAWILKNLSANGTLLNKKSIDEAVLSDGDEIRVGAKTRLKFVVEEVAPPTTGRPQFKPRTAAEEQAAAQAAAQQTETAEEQPQSLLKRRKGLFIGLGVYFLAIIGVGIALLFQEPSGSDVAELPILALDDMVRPAPGARPLRIAREAPEGIWVEDELGQPKLIPYADLQSGKAARIPGIRKAIDVQFQHERNEALAKQYKKEAIEHYLVAELPGKESHLLAAVRLFQKSLACYGSRMYFADDPAAERTRQEALRKLLAKVETTYQQALIYEKAGDYVKAWEAYKLLLRLVPERNNPIFENVSRRMVALKKRAPNPKDLK